MARGNLTRRGTESWRLKFEAGTDANGNRITKYETVRGTKKQAQAVLAKRLVEIEEGEFVTKTATTVGQYADHWIKNVAPSKASGKTLERYAELITLHISPRLGSTELQKLNAEQIDSLYAHLRTAGRRDGKGGLAPLTLLHIHRLLSQILSSAVKAKKIRSSPMPAVQTVPRAQQNEIKAPDDADITKLLAHLRDHPLFIPTLLATACGMRRGEILAVRWKDIDLDGASLRVMQTVEQTVTGISFKAPKTDRSRRTIALPARAVVELRRHKKEQAEMRLRLGLGKSTDDLVCANLDGSVRSPRLFTKQFAAAADAAGVPWLTFHALRHGHVTSLLKAGVPIHVVSARAGHANPSVTLGVYAHVMPGQQETAAAIVDSALSAALGD